MKYENEIVEYMKDRTDFVKIDDVRIDLLAPKSSRETSFDRAWKSLIESGKLILLGNSLRQASKVNI